jgi:hypothetical protein
VKGRSAGLALAAAALLGLASPASAAVLTMATWSQVTQGVPMTRTLSQLNAAGASTASSISLSLTYPQTTISLFRPKTTMGVLDFHLRITQGGAQAITATPSMAMADTGVPGSVRIRTAKHVLTGANASMLNVGNVTLLKVPLRHGQAAVQTGTFSILGQSHVFTVFHYAWTPGSLFFDSLTSKLAPLSNVLTEGSFQLSPNGAGTVALVAPSLLVVRGSIVFQTTLSVTRLELSFPEPGTALLLGAASAALVLAGLRERRS